jgi:hypothetical protein
MTFEAIYQGISKAIKEHYSFTALEKKMLDSIIKQINSNSSFTGGKLTDLNKTAGRIVTDGIRDFTQSDQYQQSIARFLSSVGDLGSDRIGIYKKDGASINPSDVNSAQKLVINEYLDSMNESGLNARYNQLLRNQIYNNIRQGASQSQIAADLRTNIVGKANAPSNLERYVTNISQTAADAYNSVIDKEVYQQFGSRVAGYRIVGSLIDTSSPQCRSFVEDYNREISIKDIDKFIIFAKENGADKKLTKENLPVLRLHVGCRHSFTPYFKI